MKEIEIQGVVTIPNGISNDEFLDAFLDFLESKGWSFGGGVNEIYPSGGDLERKQILQDLPDKERKNLK